MDEPANPEVPEYKERAVVKIETLFVVLALLSCTNLAFSQTDSDKTKVIQSKAQESSLYQYPKDPKKPVLQFDLIGGSRFPSPKGFQAEPRLQLFADGTVVGGRFEARMARRTIKISKAELESILDFVLKEHEFLEIETDTINTKIKGAGVRPMVADAPTSQFKINLKDREHTVEVYAVAFLAKFFVNIEELKHILAIQDKLRVLYNRTLAADDAQQILATVNQQQKKEYPEFSAFKLEQLDTAAVYQDGRQSFAFYRVEKDAKGKIIRTVRGHYLKKKDEDPRSVIQVSDYTKKKN